MGGAGAIGGGSVDVAEVYQRAQAEADRTGEDFRAALWAITDGLDLDASALGRIRLEALNLHARTGARPAPDHAEVRGAGSEAPASLQPLSLSRERELHAAVMELPWGTPRQAAAGLAEMLRAASPAERDAIMSAAFSRGIGLVNFARLLDTRLPYDVAPDARREIARALGRAYDRGAIDDQDLVASLMQPGGSLGVFAEAVAESGSQALQAAVARTLLENPGERDHVTQERCVAAATAASGSPEAAHELISMLLGPDRTDRARLYEFVELIRPRLLANRGDLIHNPAMASWLAAAARTESPGDALPLFDAVAGRIDGQSVAEEAVADYVDAMRATGHPRVFDVFRRAVAGLEGGSEHTDRLESALTDLFVENSDAFLGMVEPRTRLDQHTFAEFMSRAPFAADEDSRLAFMDRMGALVERRMNTAADPSLAPAKRIQAAQELGFLMGSMRLGFEIAADRDADRVAGSNGFIAWAVDQVGSRVGAMLPVPSDVVNAGQDAITAYLQEQPMTIGELEELIAPLDTAIRERLAGDDEAGLYYTNVWNEFDPGNRSYIEREVLLQRLTSFSGDDRARALTQLARMKGEDRVATLNALAGMPDERLELATSALDGAVQNGKLSRSWFTEAIEGLLGPELEEAIRSLEVIADKSETPELHDFLNSMRDQPG